MEKYLMVILSTVLCAGSAMARKPTVSPLITVKPSEFSALPEVAKLMYVAGVVDGITFHSYGSGDPEHDAFAKCMGSMKLGDIAAKVEAYIKKHPESKEGTAMAVASIAGESCKSFRGK